MTNDYRKGYEYRMRTDANFRKRKKYQAKTRATRRRLIKENPDAECESEASTPHSGPLELHHVNGDISGESGYAVMCRRHNREAAGQKPGTLNHPGQDDDGMGGLLLLLLVAAARLGRPGPAPGRWLR